MMSPCLPMRAFYVTPKNSLKFYNKSFQFKRNKSYKNAKILVKKCFVKCCSQNEEIQQEDVREENDVVNLLENIVEKLDVDNLIKQSLIQQIKTSNQNFSEKQDLKTLQENDQCFQIIEKQNSYSQAIILKLIELLQNLILTNQFLEPKENVANASEKILEVQTLLQNNQKILEHISQKSEQYYKKLEENFQNMQIEFETQKINGQFPNFQIVDLQQFREMVRTGNVQNVILKIQRDDIKLAYEGQKKLDVRIEVDTDLFIKNFIVFYDHRKKYKKKEKEKQKPKEIRYKQQKEEEDIYHYCIVFTTYQASITVQNSVFLHIAVFIWNIGYEEESTKCKISLVNTKICGNCLELKGFSKELEKIRVENAGILLQHCSEIMAKMVTCTKSRRGVLWITSAGKMLNWNISNCKVGVELDGESQVYQNNVGFEKNEKDIEIEKESKWLRLS